MCLVFLALGRCCSGVQQNVCISPWRGRLLLGADLGPCKGPPPVPPGVDRHCCRWPRGLLAAAPCEHAGDRRWAQVGKGQGSVPPAAAGCSSTLSPAGRRSVPCPLDVREKMLL